MDHLTLSKLYRDELINNIIPFWLEKSQDTKFGGFFSCLDRAGNVYDTDKFVWMQGREVWLFSMLCNNLEKRPEWLQCAIQGGEFLKKYGHDGNLNWYFSLTREGKPIIDPYNIASYVYATMAFGQLSKASENREYADIARETFNIILARSDNPKGKWEKSHPGTRNLKNIGLPMDLCNLSLEIEHLIDKDFLKKTIDTCIHEVMDVFYREELDLILENVTTENELSDTFEGRLVNPGNAIEAMWFIMDLGERLKNQELIERATRIAIRMIEYGWDKEYGGIFCFLDRKGYPPLQLEWDQKLWWVQIEALIAMSKGYVLTRSEDCLRWFEVIHDYTWDRFKDKEFPEWFGYLNRRGEVLLSLKGGKWKGCFHVPRGLYQVWKALEKFPT